MRLERSGGNEPGVQDLGQKTLERLKGLWVCLILIVMDSHGTLLYNPVYTLKRSWGSGMVVHSFNPDT